LKASGRGCSVPESDIQITEILLSFGVLTSSPINSGGLKLDPHKGEEVRFSPLPGILHCYALMLPAMALNSRGMSSCEK